MDPSVFISNLSTTCKGNSFIKEDGQKLSLFDRISDFIHGKHNYDHFKAVCEKLPAVTDISSEDQIEILGRIREIQKKITNNTVKQECEEHINRFESHILTKENASACGRAIFSDPSKRSLRKLDAILDHYADDQESMGAILSNWNGKHSDPLLDKEVALLKTGAVSDIHYEIFPLLWSASFKQINQERISTLSELMDRHADNPAFIQSCLKEVNSLLPKGPFSEVEKQKYLKFQDFLPLIDRHLPVIENTSLARNLKIKCANLPTRQARASFPNLHLSEKDQLHVLVEGLQAKEDALINKIVYPLSRPDISRLAKLVGSDSTLSDANRVKLRNDLAHQLDDIPDNWDNYRAIKRRLKATLYSRWNLNRLEELQRTSKCKGFFQNQLDLDEHMILIPRWYHATSEDSMGKILNSGEIQVRHGKAFRGAWVSSTREEGFGSYTLALSHKISELNPPIIIGFQYHDRRWRGLQRAIPISHDRGGVAIGVPFHGDKTSRTIDKLKIIKVLKNKGFPNPKAFTVKQLDLMRNQVHEILGAPNLSNEWW